MCLEGTWAPSPCSMEPKHHFGTDLKGTTFVHLTILRHQNTKTAAYQLSKNDWVRPIFLFFGFAREKSFVTVAFDRPVSSDLNNPSLLTKLEETRMDWLLREGLQ